jgi:predicted SAM-dependent methyltransferase
MIKLNIGCGPNIFPFPDWVNYDKVDMNSYVDMLKNNIVHDSWPEHQKRLANFVKTGSIHFLVHDLRTGFSQYSDSSIDIIYFGQVIEHLNPIYEVTKLLQEFYRILKPDGVIRITTPDLDLLINAYVNKQMNKFENEQPEFYKSMDDSAKLASIMYGASGPSCTWDNYEGHMFLYTKKSMTDVLEKVGFKNIKFYYEAGKSTNPIMSEEVVDAGMNHSFAVEASK